MSSRIDFILQNITSATGWVVGQAWIDIMSDFSKRILPNNMPGGIIEKAVYATILTFIMHSLQEIITMATSGAVKTKEISNDDRRTREQIAAAL